MYYWFQDPSLSESRKVINLPTSIFNLNSKQLTSVVITAVNVQVLLTVFRSIFIAIYSV